MKRINNFITAFAHFLQVLLVIALSVLGMALICLLFKELIPIVEALFASSIEYSKILDEIIIFFLFFEFLAMIIAALKNHGHTSIEFLMGLGVTALLRGLISAHNNIYQIIGISVAILLLIIGMGIFHKYVKNQL